VGTLLVAAVLFLLAAAIAAVLVRVAGLLPARDPCRVNEALNG